jgi:pheromone shutdown protein TraB
LLKREEGMSTCTQLRRYLLEHPLLVLVLGFRPVLNRDLPYGFDVAKTVPTDRWLRQQQHELSQSVLQDLLAATVRDLREEIPGLGEVVADARDPYVCRREGKQSTGLRQRTLQEGATTKRGS